MTIKEFLLTKECEGYPSAWHAYVYNCATCKRMGDLGLDAHFIADAFDWDKPEQGYHFWDTLHREHEELKNKPKQRNLVELFHTYDVKGNLCLCDKRGWYPDFRYKDFYQDGFNYLRKRSIIKDMPSRWLDLDTWELVGKDDE